MKPKILFTASVPNHFKAFHLPYLQWLQEHGYETHVACNGYEILPYVDKMWQVDFIRTPYSLKHFNAIKQLKKVIDNEDYVLINCHTPMASVLTRLASLKARKNKTKLIYTAHGFHFFKGASFINWLFYYPVELVLSYLTDAIVCINKEDYDRIRSKGNKNCDYYLIPGIGVDRRKFCSITKGGKEELRKNYGFKSDDFILVYAAEFIDRKNHDFIISAVKKNEKKLKDIKILFAGSGKLENVLQNKVIKNKLDDIIHFIGYRKDIDLIYKMADLGISSSKQEGLGLNLVEEMMCGLPVIATVDRGHKEIVDHNKNGFLFKQGDYSEFINSVLELKNNKNLLTQFSANAIKKAAKFELDSSLREMKKIYQNYLNKT